MPDEIATLKRELADLRKQVSQGGEPQDGLQMAINEIRAQYETDVENGKMKGPCVVCQEPWKDRNGNLTHISGAGHSWRNKPVTSIPPIKGTYRKDSETSLMSEEDAMKELDVDVDELRGMGLAMVKAKGVFLYRRGEVMEIAALV